MNGRRASVRRERRVVVRQESSRLDGTERRLGRPDRVIARRSGHRGLFPGGYACAGSAGTARPAARQHACAHASTSAGNAPFVAGAAARPCAGDAVLAELTSRKPAWILIDLRPVTRGGGFESRPPRKYMEIYPAKEPPSEGILLPEVFEYEVRHQRMRSASACARSSFRKDGCAIPISSVARCFADFPRNCATPYSVTT